MKLYSVISPSVEEYTGRICLQQIYKTEEKEMSLKTKSDEKSVEEAKVRTDAPKINWDQSKMKTTYANVCNVSSTREEVSVMFGTNQTMNMGQGEIAIELTDRIILNPYAAKRLAHILNGVMQQYEATFGELPVEAR